MTEEEEKVSMRLGGTRRFAIFILCFLAIFHLMILRFNLSMGLVCMVSSDTANSTATTEQAEFDWDKSVQTSILAAFFYGYICTQILGGWVSDRFGCKMPLLFGLGILSLGSLASPACARIDPHLLLLLRAAQGLSSGIAFPAVYGLFTKWSSPSERATLMSLVFAGIPAACALNFPMASFLCRTDGGWPMVFYVPGVSGLLWCLAFILLAKESPEDPGMEAAGYITEKENNTTPWLSMLTSMPVLALCVTAMCSSWAFYLVAVNLPLFAAEVFHFDIVSNGLLSSMPFIGMILLSTTGKMFDWLRNSGKFRLITLRKTFNTIGFLGPIVCNFSLFLLPEDTPRLMPILLVSLGLSVHEIATTGGFSFSHRELAGRYSTTLFGITNTAGQIPGFANPLLIAHLTQSTNSKGIKVILFFWPILQRTKEEWYSVFYVAGGISMIGCLVYLFFGSTKLQPWANEAEDGEKARVEEKLVKINNSDIANTENYKTDVDPC